MLLSSTKFGFFFSQKSDHIGKRDVRDSTSQGKNDNAKGDLESASKRDNSVKRQTASNFMQELLTAQVRTVINKHKNVMIGLLDSVLRRIGNVSAI